jgi:alkaline phosphatase D
MNVQFELGGETAYSADSWAGYEAERASVARDLAAAENAVALTGDLHSFAAGYLKPEYGEQSEPDRRVGVEFLAPAVSSANVAETLDLPDTQFLRAGVEAAVRDENPHVAFFDSHHWGYATVEFTPDAATYTAHAVEKSVPADRARAWELARFRTPAGRTDLTRR